jgi:pimeloyl-ACP methyl ester carboxylesterase
VIVSDASATLILLPGLDGTDVFLRPLVAALPKSIRTVVLSYEGEYRYGDLLRAARRSVGELSECYVLASSFSGPLAVMLAAAEPAKVRGIILCATFVRFPRPDLLPFRFALAWPLLWLIRTVRRVPVWLRQPADAWRRAKAETWKRVSARTLVRRVREIFDVDVREILRACPQPLLCLAFRDDEVIPASNAAEIVDGRPKARLATLPGKHLGIWWDPQAVSREVMHFIRQENSKSPDNAATKTSSYRHRTATLED